MAWHTSHDHRTRSLFATEEPAPIPTNSANEAARSMQRAVRSVPRRSFRPAPFAALLHSSDALQRLGALDSPGRSKR